MESGIYFDPAQLEVISIGKGVALPQEHAWQRVSDDPALRLTEVRRLLINRRQLEEHQARHLYWFLAPPEAEQPRTQEAA